MQNSAFEANREHRHYEVLNYWYHLPLLQREDIFQSELRRDKTICILNKVDQEFNNNFID